MALDASPSKYCQGCKKDRERAGQSPRELVVLPDEITALEFAKDIPLRLCSTCDGPELEAAMAEHWKRVTPED